MIRRFLADIVVAAILVLLILALIYDPVKPTEDQLYGCTSKQQAPNGDCP